MRNEGIKNKSSKVVIIFILGLICFSGLRLNNASDFISKNENLIDEILPRSSAFLENRTDYSKQLIKDPSFDLGSPWNSQEFDETNDMDANLDLNQANYKVIGDKRNFYLNGTIDAADWENFTNPDHPITPDTYYIDSDGLYVSHTYSQNENQTRNTPSIQCKQNITMPVNMSDYTITSASIESLFNATVTTDPVHNGIDVLQDDYTLMATGDYVTFYVLISDIENNKVYRIAHNKTSNLGQDLSPNIPSIFDTLMTNVTEDILLFYLSSVLETDHEHFTITIGIDIYSEDNQQGVDIDIWNDLRIKTLNLTFAYEKKIDQLTSVSWNQTGNKIDNGEYELGDDGYFIINNASLNFDYNISQDWPSSSLNSEFRIYLNNYQISKTIKLTNFSTSIQNQIIDISPSLINASENITIKIQLYIADNFLLSNNITVTIDNVNLTTFFTVVERRNPVATMFETDSLSRSITWNESFSISLNYTNASNQVGLNGSGFIVDWVDSYEIQEVGNGIYTLFCNNTHKVSSTPYTLSINTNITNTWYESNSLTLEIIIIGRETKMDVFLEEVDKTLSPEIEIYYMNQLNITTHYYDNVTSEEILGATALLEGAGIDLSYYDYNVIGSTHEFILNTTKLGLGTHLISLFLNKENYTESYKQLRITVNSRLTSIDVLFNGTDSTLSPEIELFFMDQLNITTHYYDNVFSEEILGATASLESPDIDPSYYTYNVDGSAHQFILNTTKLGLGTHLISLYLAKENYTDSYKQLRITVNSRLTSIDVFFNGTDSTLSPEIELFFMDQLNITTHYYDIDYSEEILGATASLESPDIDPSYYDYNVIGSAHEFILNTTKLGLGSHLISLYLQKENYTQSYIQLRIIVNSRQTNIDVFLDEIDMTLSPVIEVQFMNQLNITAHYYDTDYSEEILGATASLESPDIDPSYYTYDVIGSAHQFILNTTKLGIGTHLLSLFVEKENFGVSYKQIRVTVTPRQSYLNVFANGVDSSDIDEIVVPITGELNIILLEYDSESSEVLQNLIVTLDGIDASHYIASNDGTSYQFIIDTESLDLGIHLIAFSAEKTNYNPISKSFQVIVRQIQTNITTTNANQSFTIATGDDFDLIVVIEDLDFGGGISGCEISYSSGLGIGSGIINETESGTYSITFDEVPRGIYTIYISIFKGSDYNFKPFEITLNVITPPTDDQGIPTFVFYIMGVLIVGLVASFIAYQQYFKFPKTIREIRSLNKAIRKGKTAEKELSVKAANDLFVEDYISRTKGSLPSKSKAKLKDRIAPESSQKSMTKGDVKKEIKGEKVELKEKQKITPKIPKEEKKPDISRKPSSLEESLEIPKAEQPKKVESTQKIEKLKPDQFVKPHDIEKTDLKPISVDQKPKKIRYLRKPKIKKLPKKKTDKK